MQIDWFTTIAQLVNFLVLLAILKFLLFDRVARAIDERKEKIASEKDHAEAARRESETDRARAKKALAEIEAEGEQKLHEAKEVADDHRRQLEQEARHEAERMRDRFRASLADEQRQLVSELVRTAANGVTDAAKRALADLADTALEKRMAAKLFDELRQASDEERQQLSAVWGQLQSPLVVSSNHPLGEKERQQLVETLRSTLAVTPELTYRVSDELGGGIEIAGGGHRLGWSMRGYLAELEEELHALLSEETVREAIEAERDAKQTEATEQKRETEESPEAIEGKKARAQP